MLPAVAASRALGVSPIAVNSEPTVCIFAGCESDRARLINEKDRGRPRGVSSKGLCDQKPFRRFFLGTTKP